MIKKHFLKLLSCGFQISELTSKRIYYFYCNTEDDKNQWKNVIQNIQNNNENDEKEKPQKEEQKQKQKENHNNKMNKKIIIILILIILIIIMIDKILIRKMKL